MSGFQHSESMSLILEEIDREEDKCVKIRRRWVWKSIWSWRNTSLKVWPPFLPRWQNRPPLSVQRHDWSLSIAPIQIIQNQSEIGLHVSMSPPNNTGTETANFIEPHTYLHHTSNEPILNNANSISESPRKGVHGADVSDEQVLQVCGLSAHLSIKVQASWLKATLFNDGLPKIGHSRITRYHCSHLNSCCASHSPPTVKASQCVCFKIRILTYFDKRWVITSVHKSRVCKRHLYKY